MRSELVTAAVPAVRNRFLLVHVASVITRKFHRPSKERVQDSINNALAGIGERKYLLTGNVVGMGELDLDWFNGFTGEAQCSYVRPENVPALHEALAMAETA
jgi:hypothetical protein